MAAIQLRLSVMVQNKLFYISLQYRSLSSSLHSTILTILIGELWHNVSPLHFRDEPEALAI